MKIKTLLYLPLAAVILASCGSTAADTANVATDQTNAMAKTDTITILQTADIHGQLNVHDELFYENEEIVFRRRGGIASIKTIFDRTRAANPEGTIILDGGDLIQGSAVAALSEGRAFVPIVREMGFDFLIPGNWEVVYGKNKMIDVMMDYQTPVIAANMFHSESGETLFPPYFIKEVKGMKLGFISYNDPEVPIRQNPSFSVGMDFTPVEHNLAALITELKEEKGVDLLFIVSHIGIAKQMHLANDPALKQVDYVLGNDTHERIRQPLQGKYAKVTEPGAFGSFVGRLDLVIQDGKVVDEIYELIEVDPEVYAPDAAMQAIVDAERAKFEKDVDEVWAQTTTPLYRYFVVENPMDNLITDAARWKTGADISLSNGFRFSPPLFASEEEPANITAGLIWNMLPVDEYVKTGKASGEQIANWLEQEIHNVFAENAMERFGGWMVRFSGMTVKFNAKAPKGERVQEILVAGKPIDANELYSVSACRRDGEPDDMLCRLPNALDTEVQDYTIHDVMEEYLKHKGTVSPVTEKRAVALDLGPNVLSQLPGTDYQFY